MEASAEAFDVVLVELALAAEDFGDDAGRGAIDEGRVRSEARRDFSLRKPTTSQERGRRKKRRLAPFEMTAGCRLSDDGHRSANHQNPEGRELGDGEGVTPCRGGGGRRGRSSEGTRGGRRTPSSEWVTPTIL